MKFLRKIWDSLHSKPNQEYVHNDDMQYAGGIVTPTVSRKSGEKLTDQEKNIMSYSLPNKLVCPDCVTYSLVDGPKGGGCINVYCTNIDCASEFNDMGPFGWVRISDRSPGKTRLTYKTGYRLSPYEIDRMMSGPCVCPDCGLETLNRYKCNNENCQSQFQEAWYKPSESVILIRSSDRMPAQQLRAAQPPPEDEGFLLEGSL